MDNLKKILKSGATVIFNNEKTAQDNFITLECTYKNEALNSWANGFKIDYDRGYFSYKTFNAFYKKFEQLKNNFNLELISITEK